MKPIFKLAYLTNQYPKVSHTFIRREILALEKQGTNVQRIALRGWDEVLVDEADRLEQSKTWYVLQDGCAALLWAMTREFLTNTHRFSSALKLAIRVGWRDIRPLLYHLAYLAEACRLLPMLKSLGVTHVHAHFSTNPTEIAMLTGVLGGPDYSFTVHGTDDFEIMQFFGFQEKIHRAKFIVASCSYGRSQLYRWTEHTQWFKIKLTHCGLDPIAFPPSPPTTSNQRRFVCVGRLCKEKGQILLVKAAHQLLMKGLEFELVLAGDGEMRSILESLVADLGLNACVKITGWLSGDEVREQILAARALILPSFAEGLPVVIMEAMALRRPILATYVAGIPELVRHGKDGWLFPPGDLSQLTAAMEACLMCTSNELETMGNEAYDRVIKRHSIDIESAKLNDFFQNFKNHLDSA